MQLQSTRKLTMRWLLIGFFQRDHGPCGSSINWWGFCLTASLVSEQITVSVSMVCYHSHARTLRHQRRTPTTWLTYTEKQNYSSSNMSTKTKHKKKSISNVWSVVPFPSGILFPFPVHPNAVDDASLKELHMLQERALHGSHISSFSSPLMQKRPLRPSASRRPLRPRTHAVASCP